MTRKNAITPLLDDRYDLPPHILRRLKTPLALTKTGMIAERLCRAYWPFWTLLLIVLSGAAFGLHEALAPGILWVGALVVFALGAWTFVRGFMRFKMPSRVEVFQRLDATLPGRPIAALSDTQAIGTGDAASEAVWNAHLERMADRAAEAKAVEPNLNLAPRDPFALRYLALTVFVVALLFGSLWRVATVAEAVTAGPNGVPVAAGPAWEGWVEPPLYTGMPSLYLNDIEDEKFTVPVGSNVTVRLYGETGALSVEETVSGNTAPTEDEPETVQSFEINRDGKISVRGQGGRTWEIATTADAPPTIMLSGEISRSIRGEMKQPFTAADDYGVVSGRAEIVLDLKAVDRRYGLEIDPEQRDALILDLPMTITGDRTAFEEVMVEDLSKHPWANLPVRMALMAVDAKGQEGRSSVNEIILPGRRFFDPLANAIIEQRRDLLWNRENLGRTIQLLRTITYKPEGLFHDNGDYLQLRVVLRRMETAMNVGGFTPEARDEMAEVLWEIALRIEEGDLSDALEQLRRAQDRLSEAMRNGASQEEIDELMRELAEAMQNYMRQLAEQSEGNENQSAENSETITGDQFRQMLDEIQRLMEEGRMAEAQALLQQLMEMMENLQITQGEGGEPTPGERSMDELSDTLRDQQELSDDAFRDLQERFNPDMQQPQGGQGQQGQQNNGQNQPGQQGNQGEQQGQGQQGQSQGGQNSSPEGRGQQQGMGPSDGERRSGQGDGGIDGQSLAERQRGLRRELERQERNLPGAGTPEGDAARESLDRAGRAMENAEEALRNEDLSRAIDQQAEALDALREGLRNLGQALANNNNPGEDGREGGEQGQAFQDGQNPDDSLDPLGRGRNDGGGSLRGSTGKLSQGENPYGKAEELQDEIRRRSGDQSRPEAEREYLERLLERY